MPQFEVQHGARAAVFVRARGPEDAVAKTVGASGPDESGAVDVGPPAPGTGWRPVTVDGEPWGRVRARDRMRFRRD